MQRNYTGFKLTQLVLTENLCALSAPLQEINKYTAYRSSTSQKAVKLALQLDFTVFLVRVIPLPQHAEFTTNDYTLSL